MVGPAKIMVCGDTLRVSDYDKYNWTMFDPESKKSRHDAIIPADCQMDFALGAEMISNPCEQFYLMFAIPDCIKSCPWVQKKPETERFPGQIIKKVRKHKNSANFFAEFLCLQHQRSLQIQWRMIMHAHEFAGFLSRIIF